MLQERIAQMITDRMADVEAGTIAKEDFPDVLAADIASWVYNSEEALEG